MDDSGGVDGARIADAHGHAVLVPGGVVVLDSWGGIRFGVRESAFEDVDGEAPDWMRLAVAHLASMHVAGLSSKAAGREPEEEAERIAAHVHNPSVDETAQPHRIGDVTVLRATGHLDPDLSLPATEAWQRGECVLPAVRRREVILVGPLIAPPQGPCLICLQRAVMPNRHGEALLDLPTDPRLDSAIAEACTRMLTSRRENLHGMILAVDDRGDVVAEHPVRTFPDCPMCGSDGASPRNDRPVLRSRRKHRDSDTGARVSGPADVFARYRQLVSPVTGAVRHVREVDLGAPELLHIWTASHAVATESVSLAEFMRDGKDHSGGKGSTREQARASALCEALERFSAVYRGTEVDVLAPMTALSGAISPADCMLFSERQYRERADSNAASRSRFAQVPAPFDPTTDVGWSRVWPIDGGEAAWLPTALLYFGFRGPGRESCYADSNGLAAGQTLEEAILQGFMELVERDAVAIWWYNRTRHAPVAVESFDDPYLDAVIEHYDGLDRDAWVLDVTSDLGIPVFVAISARRHGAPEIIFGFGAHFDPAIALRRCITEMNQLLATVVQPDERRTGQLRGGHEAALDWWREGTLSNNQHLLPDAERAPLTMRDWAYEPTTDILIDVDSCCEVARQHGLRVFVHDMSRADLGIAVAKVIVPGLRHFWRRLAPGRLYDVPVAEGLLASCASEEDLNPVSLFV